MGKHDILHLFEMLNIIALDVVSQTLPLTTVILVKTLQYFVLHSYNKDLLIWCLHIEWKMYIPLNVFCFHIK